MSESISSLDTSAHPLRQQENQDFTLSSQSLIAGASNISPEIDSAEVLELPMACADTKRQTSTMEAPATFHVDAASNVSRLHNTISRNPSSEIILQGRLADLNSLIKDGDGLAVPQNLQNLIVRVLREIETWLNRGGAMKFKAQTTLSNMAYNSPAKDNTGNQFSCKDEKCLLSSYLSILRSATNNGSLSDEKRRISLNLLRESEDFVNETGNTMTNKDHQDELNLLHIICDSNIALHSIETAIQALDKGQQAQESSELNRQGVELLQHFGRFGDVTGLEIAVAMLSRAVAYTPVNSPDRPGRLNSLGNSHASRFERFGEVRDIDSAIERQCEAAASASLDSPDLPGFLTNLGNSHICRFERFGEVKDIDSAIKQQLRAVASTPLDSAHRPGFLNNLAITYRSRFKRFGEVNDIDSAIKRQLEAVASIPLNSAHRPGHINNLGSSYILRFQRFGEAKDIDLAIEKHLEAVASTPLDSAYRPGFLNNLGNAYQNRFERFGKEKDIDSAIERQVEAVASTPIDSAQRPGRLNNLATAYQSRFERFGKVEDIDLAIEQQLKAVGHTPLDSAERPGRLNNLGNSYMFRFERFGEVEDIDSAIEQQLEAVSSTPLDSARRPVFLTSLGNSLTRRFERFGEVKDIDLAIDRQLEAVASTPLISAHRAERLNNLGNSYMCRFERSGEVKDIDSAIEQQLKAVTSTPFPTADRPGLLNNLATSYRRRFERLGEVEDIDSAIERQLEAVASTPLISAHRAGRLNNLGNSYICRFQRFGEVKDVDSAIEQHLEALASTPRDSADYARRLNNLGCSYMCRFQRFRETKDIDLAIERQLEAVTSTPLDSAHRPAFLANLGNSHIHRFEQLWEVKDIDLAIERQLEAVASAPQDSVSRSALLNSLGSSYQSCFERFGKVKDINLAIERQLEAVSSTPLNSAHRAGRLNNLGTSYTCRFERFGEVKDVDSAIERQREAVASTPVDSADRAGRLNDLGHSHMRRFESIRELPDLHKSISNFRLSSISLGFPSSRIRGSLQWARLTHHLSDLRSASEAYDQAMRLLPQVAWIGLSAVAQLNNLNSDIQSLGCNAAACMISLAQTDSHDQQRYLGRAVELLDQGRSILWSQTSNFKRDLEDLRKDHSQLACELDLAGKVLGQGCFRSSNDTLSETDDQLYRRSAEKWEELVSRIRTLSGFHHFLLPPPISALRTAAVHGPVVIINSSEYRCDAVIIPAQADSDLVLVPLPDVTAAKLHTLTRQQEKFASRQSRIGIPLNDDDYAEPPCIMTLESVLHQTWSLVGEPIVKKFKELELVGLGTSAPCRVWWCLTGSLSFLPIHASFSPTDPAVGMMDTIVSSYTPTISALLRAQQRRKQVPTFRMLAVGQSEASGMTPLPGVTEEIAFISEKLGTDAQTLQEYKATVDEVAISLSTCSWAHFACHGVQDPEKPMDSGLLLWDGHRLTLSRLAQSSLASAEFAFLSCCQSATGSKQFPNEAVHLAAGLQFIGFRGVIGTMWSVGDNDALNIAMQVYGELFKNGNAQASPSEAAVALHQAVCHLRDHWHVPLIRWVPFVHFGL